MGDPLLGHGVGGGKLKPWGSIAQLTFPWASPGFLARWVTVPALNILGGVVVAQGCMEQQEGPEG